MTITPALARATEALAAAQRRTVTPMHALDARTAVSAALHDPDDPDWLARLIDAHSPFTITTSPPVRCECGRWIENHGRHMADALSAAILGEAR
jgi:hypothetical protein